MPGKVRYHQLSDSEKKKCLGDFYSMISLLKNRQDAKNFFKDLLTLSETVMISRRIQIAKLLLGGSTYDEIRRQLKVGPTTICQVEKWLNNGFGGYRKTIEEYKRKYPDRSDFDRYGYPAFSKEWVKKKYPIHYLFTNLLNKKK